MKFMQKYHHGGAFFQDKKADGSEPIYLRSAAAPVQSEKGINRELLPKYMQQKRHMFGKMGQTKHKSLKDDDTTDFSSAWVDKDQREKRDKWLQKEADKKRMVEEMKYGGEGDKKDMGKRAAFGT
jgi:hypothetical protein